MHSSRQRQHIAISDLPLHSPSAKMWYNTLLEAASMGVRLATADKHSRFERCVPPLFLQVTWSR
jgi:hypothetical protein